jgi:hypothetical protein
LKRMTIKPVVRKQYKEILVINYKSSEYHSPVVAVLKAQPFGLLYQIYYTILLCLSSFSHNSTGCMVN